MPADVPIVAEDIPPDEVAELIESVADGLVRRRLTTPALLALEMCKPLNFLGSQALVALQPFVAAFVDPTGYRKLALVLERDSNVELLMRRIEALEATANVTDRRERPRRRSVRDGISAALARLRRTHRDG